MTSAPDKEPDASGDDVQPEKKTTNRWKMYAKPRTVLVGAPFVLLPAGLIGTGWDRIVDGIREIGEWNGGLYSFGFVIVVLGLGLWLFEPIEPNDKYGASGVFTETAHPSRFSWIELVFVLFSLLSLAGGMRVLTVMHEEGKAQLAAGLFAAGGLALSFWATQRRSLEQQEREDKRQNDRLESESLRESRQLSVQQRMDMSKKLQTSIDHLSSKSEVVCAAAISELMFQIDDWNALIQGEITEIETRKPHDAKQRVEQLKAEGLRRRQELFDLAMKDYVSMCPQTYAEPENRNDLRFRDTLLDARRRGLRSAQELSFVGVDFAGIALPSPRETGLEKGWVESDEWRTVQGTAYLPCADLRWAHLERVNMWGARLDGVNLWCASMDGVNLMGARLSGANMVKACLKGANLMDADLIRAVMVRSCLQGTNLRTARLNRANLTWANLEGADLMGANLEETSLRGACLRSTDLVEANLEGADLVWGSLEGADLVGARLNGAKLVAVANDGSLVSSCSFDSKTLWAGATYSPSTVFPEGFDPEAEGMILVNDLVLEDPPGESD
ncbi:pentapeptide repeat-containing protein [Corynebacterium sp. CCM 9203]|uniref:pentapeptide repeat-containing protein n=1 Tax=Corynebacterium sp. CCM 9203 TaxID=3057615 RepID=UPI0035233D27